jgi:hypothetical protein
LRNPPAVHLSLDHLDPVMSPSTAG